MFCLREWKTFQKQFMHTQYSEITSHSRFGLEMIEHFALYLQMRKLKQVLAINSSVCSKVTAGGTAFKRLISLLVTHPEFSEHEPHCSQSLSGHPFSLSQQCFLGIQGEKWTWSDLHIRNSKMLVNSLKHKPYLSSSSFLFIFEVPFP